MGVVVDSSVFISAERGDVSILELLERMRRAWGDEELAVSVISAMELVHGIWRAHSAAVRTRRQEYVEEVFARVPVRPVTLRIARIAGEIDATRRAKGTTIPTADLLIGATALDLGFEVATGNVRHFRLVPNLRVRRLP